MEALAREGVTLISNRDLPAPDRVREPWGLCRVGEDGGCQALLSPYWHWGNVYAGLVRDMFSGSWDAVNSGRGRAVNYWWGMRGRAIDILLGEELPAGSRQLAEILRRGIIDGSILPFPQATPEEILYQDRLEPWVEGTIPGYEEILPMARAIVRLQGVYRDKLSPEQGDPIL